MDDEERILVEAIEQGDHFPGESQLTEARAKELQAAARATINEGNDLPLCGDRSHPPGWVAPALA